MNRSTLHDYAKFAITRLGDTNAPSYTVTNFTYLGTALFPADYTAQAQRFNPPGNPIDGAPGIVINPGDIVITNVVGNPVAHGNLNLAPTNVTITISLTNLGHQRDQSRRFRVLCQQQRGYIDRTGYTVGSEVVLWSNPLTDSSDSVNWTLTFASTSFAPNTVLPVVVPNYTNSATSLAGGGTNDFNVTFGYPVC